jgi:hypothetical protein
MKYEGLFWGGTALGIPWFYQQYQPGLFQAFEIIKIEKLISA